MLGALHDAIRSRDEKKDEPEPTLSPKKMNGSSTKSPTKGIRWEKICRELYSAEQFFSAYLILSKSKFIFFLARDNKQHSRLGQLDRL